MNQPSYFDKVRLQAEEDWRIWADDRHGRIVRQLFRQVQSPKHVLSELLQNADDAGAKVASITITEGNFIFSHDGQDFDEDQFASICSFAVSSKKTIHTIGFRGIGFKSTFSLGSSVFLSSPTLAVRFDAEKFTLPHWEKNLSTSTLTTIAVPKIKAEVIDDLLQNFSRWSREPYSLLFQKSVRRLELPSQVIDWHEMARPAPVGCTWFKSREEQDACLVIRSAPAPFPEDAESEISEERELATTDGSSLPPCTVDLILGAPGRIYVALPTDVETNLPFAVNGPFIQDPGRFGIKPPSTSPTNKWLLERAGMLAAETMLSWLRDDSLGTEERASAYELMPSSRGDRDSLANQVEGLIAEAFWTRLEGEAFVLLSDGTLGLPEDSLFVAIGLHGIWPDDSLPNIAGHNGKMLGSSTVSKAAVRKLSSEAGVAQVTVRAFAKRLTEIRPPKPESHELLARLWIAAHEDLRELSILKLANIIPVADDPHLSKSGLIDVLPPKPSVLNVSDWELLCSKSSQVCPHWVQFLSDVNDAALRGIWADLGIGKQATVDSLLNGIIGGFYRSHPNEFWIQCLHICAKCNLTTPNTMQVVTSEDKLAYPSAVLAPLKTDRLAETLTEDFQHQHSLNSAYFTEFDGQPQVLESWLGSSKSGFMQWVRPESRSGKFYSETELQKTFPIVNLKGSSYPHVRRSEYYYQHFLCSDYSFCRDYVPDGELWLDFLRENLALLLTVLSKEWSSCAELHLQLSTTGGKNPGTVKLKDSRASWIHELCNSPTLKDEQGTWRCPSELYIRCDATECLDGVEPFLDSSCITDESGSLLELLGVNKKPRNVERLFERLQSLSEGSLERREEVMRLYKQIDRTLPQLPREQDRYGQVIDPLRSYKNLPLIFTERHGWKRPSEAFKRPGSVDLPDTPLVLQDLRSLDLWDKLGVREEPDFSDVLKYVASIPSGELAEDDARRVVSCIARNPNEIWALGKWFNCEGRWVAVSSLRYKLNKDSGISSNDLMPQFQRTTADLTKFQCPSCQLPDILSQCQVRFEPLQAGQGQPLPDWLSPIVDRLKNVSLDDEALQRHVQERALSLSKSLWVQCRKISKVQLIEGDQVFADQGTSKVYWDEAGERFFLIDLDEADESKAIGKCLSEALGWTELETIIAFCWDRPERRVLGYIQKHIAIAERNDEPEGVDEGDKEAEQGSVVFLDEEEDDDSVEVRGALPSSRRLEQSQPRVKVQRHERGKPGRLIEDYAEIEGFEYAQENSYAKPSDGHSLVKRKEQEFPWFLSKNREVLMQIYPLMERLGSDGVIISYERRKLLERKPDYYALLIQDDDGAPLLLTGSELLKREQSGEITCHIAEYRLRSKRED